MLHLLLPFDLAAALLTAYAIATLCLIGFPDFTSARTFALNASLLVDFFNGMITSLSSLVWQF
jgi:hypothetical protein